MPHTTLILKVDPVTHDVRRFTVRKPQGYRFEPGQATLVSIDRPGWRRCGGDQGRWLSALDRLAAEHRYPVLG